MLRLERAESSHEDNGRTLRQRWLVHDADERLVCEAETVTNDDGHWLLYLCFDLVLHYEVYAESLNEVLEPTSTLRDMLAMVVKLEQEQKIEVYQAGDSPAVIGYRVPVLRKFRTEDGLVHLIEAVLPRVPVPAGDHSASARRIPPVPTATAAG
jgi:hypothetical protein